MFKKVHSAMRNTNDVQSVEFASLRAVHAVGTLFRSTVSTSFNITKFTNLNQEKKVGPVSVSRRGRKRVF